VRLENERDGDPVGLSASRSDLPQGGEVAAAFAPFALDARD